MQGIEEKRGVENGGEGKGEEEGRGMGEYLVESRGLGLELAQEHPQGQDVVHCWEGPHSDYELHVWMLGLMHTEHLDLRRVEKCKI